MPEITSCVSALLTHTMTVDDRIERRLTKSARRLLTKQAAADAPVADSCQRLNSLVSAMLTETRAGGAETPALEQGTSQECHNIDDLDQRG